MKLFFLRMAVFWRRLRGRSQARHDRFAQDARRVQALMSRADPQAPWHERANWMIDVAEWVRHQPKVTLRDEQAWLGIKHARLAFLLTWLDGNREVRRTVQMTLQRTLREASGPELFSATGLPYESAFFSELTERVATALLPRHLSPSDLPALFTAMFPASSDAQWMLELDQDILARLWKLAADDGIAHLYRQQIDEALVYLCTVIIAEGISPAFRQRLEPKMPLQATPFMVLRRELEAYLRGAPDNEGTLRSLRMLIAVCQAQTDRIYAHLDEYGVSVSLVYRVERMRAQLLRMTYLIDLRIAGTARSGGGRVQMLLADLIDAHHNRASVRALVRRSFALLARKMVERNGVHGEHYIARDRAAYRAMLKAAYRGGLVTAGTVLLKTLAGSFGMPYFFQGLFASLNYTASFLLISAIGGVLATKQPAVTAPALAARMGELDTVEGLHQLMAEIAMLLRSQAAAIFGNVAAVIPAMLGISFLFLWLHGAAPLNPAKAQAMIGSLSAIGPTPLFAALTGVLLWLASLVAGFADNWFALRKLPEALAHQRQLVRVLGAVRTERLAHWLEHHISTIAGNVALGLLLGMTPALAHFFGLPVDVRHVTLATGSLTAAAAGLGWQVLATPPFWLAVAGVIATALLNVGVAFACALGLALRAREVPRRTRRLVFRLVLRRFMLSPFGFLFPPAAAEGGAEAEAGKGNELDSNNAGK
ncbi:preprotein translocase subunit TatB [Oxalobacteraceae bacterium CAVE-383]|nr:preprotein translocase subunit TatB [Oxalobacteraceae bacterium CAVE-383]